MRGVYGMMMEYSFDVLKDELSFCCACRRECIGENTSSYFPHTSSYFLDNISSYLPHIPELSTLSTGPGT